MTTDSATFPRHSHGTKVKYWAPVFLYMGLIFFLSAQSHPEEHLPKLLFQEVSDKILHAMEYGILAVLSYRAARYASGTALTGHAVLFAILFSSFYGITDEVHQLFVPLRESSWLDWAADTAGAVLASYGWSRVSSDG